MSLTKRRQPICLYRYPPSGHCHRVHTFLSMLELPHELIDVDLKKQAQKEPSYLSKNPLGQVPMIEDGELVLSDSTAILVYLAKQYGNSQWLPDDPVGAAQVQRFLSMASGEIAHGLHAARRVKVFNAPLDHDAAEQTAQRILSVLEMALERSAFLVGTTPTIADLAVYSYVARAPEGEVSPDPFVNIRTWLARVEALPGFVPMPHARQVRLTSLEGKS
ncbi:MAG: hypothetical protein JWR40_1961 [Massilia sp.]|nr:hypothetical protein [Massilia sp.]